MVSLDKAVVARINRFGHHFEVLIDPDGALLIQEKMRKGDKIADQELRDILAVDQVFTHWSDGKKASHEELMKAFETSDVLGVARKIVAEGEVQLTEEQRRKMSEAKHKRILETILRNAWNPQTKTPHPKERIERALEEAKFKVDPLKHVDEQVKDAMAKLRPLLPIAFDRAKIAIKIPAIHTGHLYGVLKSMGDIKKEEWQDDGSLVIAIEIPAGQQGELFDRINHLTHGQVETKLLPSI